MDNRRRVLLDWWGNGGAQGFYLRPSGTTYGTGDGTSYNNAWSGWSEVDQALVAASGKKLFVGGTHLETFTLSSSGASGLPFVIEGLSYDPAIVDGENTRLKCIDIISFNYITVNNITFTRATSDCANVAGTANNIIFNDCLFTLSGNQGCQNDGTAQVTYNYCTFTDSVDDGVSLHTDSNVTLNYCTIEGNAQGINGIQNGVLVANYCTIKDNTSSGVIPTASNNYTLNNCFIENNSVNCDSTVATVLYRCRITNSLVRPSSTQSTIISECRFVGTAYVISRSTAATAPIVRRCYFSGTGTGGRFIRTENSGKLRVEYCVFKYSTNVYSFEHTSSSTLVVDNCSSIGGGAVANGGRGCLATVPGLTVQNSIFYSMQFGYVTSGTGTIQATNCDVNTLSTIASGTNITRTGEITTAPEFVDVAGDDFTTGNNMKDVGVDTGATTGINSATWGDATTAPIVVTAEQAGTYDIGAYI